MNKMQGNKDLQSRVCCTMYYCIIFLIGKKRDVGFMGSKPWSQKLKLGLAIFSAVNFQVLCIVS